MKRPFVWLTGVLRLLPVFALSFCGAVAAHASATGVPAKLVVTPAAIREGSIGEDGIKTRVILQAPSPCYFICELRSSDRHQLTLTDIIFKKGDTEGAGTGKVDWAEVTLDGSVKISAFSVDAPEKSVSVTVTLQKKPEDVP